MLFHALNGESFTYLYLLILLHSKVAKTPKFPKRKYTEYMTSVYSVVAIGPQTQACLYKNYGRELNYDILEEPIAQA